MPHTANLMWYFGGSSACAGNTASSTTLPRSPPMPSRISASRHHRNRSHQSSLLQKISTACRLIVHHYLPCPPSRPANRPGCSSRHVVQFKFPRRQFYLPPLGTRLVDTPHQLQRAISFLARRRQTPCPPCTHRQSRPVAAQRAQAKSPSDRKRLTSHCVQFGARLAVNRLARPMSSVGRQS